MSSLDKYFEILELRPGTSLDEIKHAYRDLAQIWHPDRYSHNPRLRAKAEERFKSINEAYEKLISEAQNYRQTPPPRSESRPSQRETKSEPPKPPPPRRQTAAKQHWRWTLPLLPFILFVLSATLRLSNAPKHPTSSYQQYEPPPPVVAPFLSGTSQA